MLQNLLLLYESRNDLLVVFVFYLSLHFCFSMMIALNGRFQLEVDLDRTEGKLGELRPGFWNMSSSFSKQNATRTFATHLSLGLKAMLDPGSTLSADEWNVNRFKKPSSGREDLVLKTLQVIGLTFIPFALHNIILMTMMNQRGEKHMQRASASWFMARSMVIMSIDEEIIANQDPAIGNYFSPPAARASWQYHPSEDHQLPLSENQHLDDHGRRLWRNFPQHVNEKLSELEKVVSEQGSESGKGTFNEKGIDIQGVELEVWCGHPGHEYEKHTLTIHVMIQQKIFTFLHPHEHKNVEYKVMKSSDIERRYFHKVPRVSALIWNKMNLEEGPQRPEGNEIENPKLAQALQKRQARDRAEFTQREWDGFGISNLSHDSFIRVVVGNCDSFFQPLSACSWVVDLTLDLKVLPEQFSSYLQSSTQCFKCEECGHTLFESTDESHPDQVRYMFPNGDPSLLEKLERVKLESLERVTYKCKSQNCRQQFLRSKCPKCHTLSVASCPRCQEVARGGDARASGSGAK